MLVSVTGPFVLMNFCNMLKGREVHFGEASVAIDKVKASKGFDGKEKTVSPFIRF